MLVRRDEEGVLAIGQLSHAWLCGQLARAQGSERFPRPEPSEEVALGAEQHDIGWASFDLRPGISSQSGLPHNFLETSVEEHLAIWGSAPERLLSVSEHAALVVSLHGSALSELRLGARTGGEPSLEAHIAAKSERQAQLRSGLGLSELQAQLIQRQMWTWDGLSLALCSGWDPFTAHDVPETAGFGSVELRSAGNDGFLVDPWPFSGPTLEVRCEARRGWPSPMRARRRCSEPWKRRRRVTLVFRLVGGS